MMMPQKCTIISRYTNKYIETATSFFLFVDIEANQRGILCNKEAKKEMVYRFSQYNFRCSSRHNRKSTLTSDTFVCAVHFELIHSQFNQMDAIRNGIT